MKKILILTFFILIFSSIEANAQSETKIDSKINDLKDKVASRVAELNLVQRKGIIGIVEAVKGNQITITDIKGNTRIIDADEITKFSSSEDDKYDLSNIKKGSKISALGLYNKESERLLARFINEISVPLFLTGIITDKNQEVFTITLITEDTKSYIVDIENISKTYSFSEGELNDIGFTKINNLENAVVVGFVNPKDEYRITASKIITFPGTPKNPKIDLKNITHAPSPSPTPDEN